MSYQAIFKGWSKVTIGDLIVAYRKAKTDCYFENTFPTAIKFAEYEQDLLANLAKLLEWLHGETRFDKKKSLLGEYRVVPKKLGLERRSDSVNGHVYFSSSERAYESLIKNNNIKPEFRIIGDFPVDTHIISALWINMVGHKFDACLNDACYGARLKRVRNDDELSGDSEKPFHITAAGSFAPYFQPYQKWRADGLNAIREELNQDRDVIASSIDLKGYYHFIDPLVISSESFQNGIGLVGNKSLSEHERLFTNDIATLLNAWSLGASKFAKELTGENAKIPGGLVIGLTASRIISNVILYRWDTLIKEKITPVHYGRYVDDMFLVLRDPGTINSTDDLMKFLQQRIGGDVLYEDDRAKVNFNEKTESFWNIQQGNVFQGKSEIRLQAEKQKLFILQGQSGKDLLDSIEQEIYELSSEHRLMPSPDQLEDTTATRVLSAAGDVGEHADNLRRADGLTIRRLGWSLKLRHVETLARDLPANEWRKHREEFYEFAHNHILRPDNLFAHYTYLPRLLGFAISLNEWGQAERIVKSAYTSLEQLSNHVVNGSEISINGMKCTASGNLWRYIIGTLTWTFVDAAARFYSPEKLLSDNRSKNESRLAALFVDQIFSQLTNFNDLLMFKFETKDFYEIAPLLAIADLARVPYKTILSSGQAGKLFPLIENRNDGSLIRAFESLDLVDVESLAAFLSSSRRKRLVNVKPRDRKRESLAPYFFPTRPYTPAEIAELAPECVGLNPKFEGNPAMVWAKYVRALRGVWVKPALLSINQDESNIDFEDRKRIIIGNKKKNKVVVALTNIKTDDDDWAAMASGKPRLTVERYARIVDLVNHAIKLKPKPDYLLFPELSLPLQWVDSIASRLSSSGISLIAGTEYRHYSKNEIISEACLVLTDDRLGFPSYVKIWQEKLQPAVKEDKDLAVIHGKTWYYPGALGKRQPKKKKVYDHNGFQFGLMVCSELQNSKDRIDFQGNVDSLMVLSWNQDLETFSALIESAAIDIHAYAVLVNNRKYGDSRVRSPAKESFNRDLARVRGGDNDFCVVVTLDIDKLRAFQSRAKRWPEDGDFFKPVPEGFRPSPSRKRLPPK